MEKSKTAQQADTSAQTYRNLIHPRTIAVIGASNDPLKPGGRVIKNIKENGFNGQLWAVNPKAGDVLGLPTFPAISLLPAAPDLAIVAIPGSLVLGALEELAGRKTGAVIVLTAGFGEKDDAGRRAEQKMRKIADAARMALIGPNCSGFLTATYKGKFAGIVPPLPGGAVDIISGSGATVDFVMENGSSRGLSFGTVLNLGNSVQMGVEDLLQLYDENYGPENARILMLYMESVNKPAKLLRHARSLAAKGCAMVGIKSGATVAGERAAASHTGAMATNDTAVAALFQKAGIIRVRSRAAMVDTACALSVAKGPLKGKRVCVITDAGGPGVMMSDELHRRGLELPLLKTKTRQLLAGILPPESATANPIDALPSRTADQIRQIIRVLGEQEQDQIDVIAILLGDSGMSDNTPIYQVVSEAMDNGPIPVFPMLSSLTSCRPLLDDFIAGGKVFFPDEVGLAGTLGKLAGWRGPGEAPAGLARYDRKAVARALDSPSGPLSPGAVSAVLRAAGFNLPRQTEVYAKEQLAAGCAATGFPLVMKVIGPLHKTDVGGVKTGLANQDDAWRAWDDLLGIDGAEGVLLQPVISGPEVILGATREGDFGHLVMFGLGGIQTEVLKDVQFGLAPLSEPESRGMIQGIRGRALLAGHRGSPGMDIDVLVDQVQRLSRLVHDFPQIKEIDLNPVKGTGSDLYAVDARILLD